MTATVYRVKNIFANKGYLCLKVLKRAFLKHSINEQSKKDKTTTKNKFWDDDEDEDDKEEEPEIDFNEIKKLLNEYLILNELNHPNIVKVYGFYYGDKNNNPSILLEYCKSNLLKAIDYLENADIISIIYEICSAMKYVHSKKIIHRDLKMQNILINSKKHVNICDFGIANVLDETTISTITHNAGTMLFMAPEIYDQEQKITEKVDVYSFGVILYFLVTKGKYPKYSGPGSYEKVRLSSSINKLTANIIKSCWSNVPEKRPSFDKILNYIVKNGFLLIDGIENDLPSIKQHLGLD